MRTMKLSSIVAATLPCLLTCLALSGCASGALSGGSGGACAVGLSGPQPSGAVAGETFRLQGSGFRDGCNDAGPRFLRRSEPPQQDIRIDLRQGGKMWGLATIDADSSYKFDAKLEIPPDAEPGRAFVVIRAGDDLPMEVPFEVLNSGPRNQTTLASGHPVHN